MGENRRTQTRHDVSLVASLNFEEHHAWKETSLVNLSLGGAFLTYVRQPIGTPCRVRFAIPTQAEQIETEAVVRWATDLGIGIQFQSLRARDVYSLGKFFEQIAK